MAVLRMPDIRKLSAADAQKKLSEMERVLLELMGQGKRDKTRPVKKAIARLKTVLHEFSRNPGKSGKNPKVSV